MKYLKELMLPAFLPGILVIAAFLNSAGRIEETPVKTVVLGKQEWMSQNLNVDRFRNGDKILHAKTNAEWIEAAAKKKPAWCYYNCNPQNGKKYGKLYNWFAVDDPRGLAPQGFQIPSEDEWETMADFLEDQNGDMLENWNTPGGYRNHDGSFRELGKSGNWWSAEKYLKILAVNFSFDPVKKKFTKQASDQPIGFSVRCIQD